MERIARPVDQPAAEGTRDETHQREGRDDGTHLRVADTEAAHVDGQHRHHDTKAHHDEEGDDPKHDHVARQSGLPCRIDAHEGRILASGCMPPAYCDRPRVERTATACSVVDMKANKQLSDNMQAVLVDLIELHLQGKQAHWNVVGTNFRDTHLILDEVVEAARGLSDEIAERMRALHALPDGRSETVSVTTTLPKFPGDQVDTAEVVSLITERLEAAAATCRRVHDEVDEADPTTADILHKVIETLEQYAWMVSAESLKPRKRNADSGL